VWLTAPRVATTNKGHYPVSGLWRERAYVLSPYNFFDIYNLIKPTYVGQLKIERTYVYRGICRSQKAERQISLRSERFIQHLDALVFGDVK
jgi:hypothetical protein